MKGKRGGRGRKKAVSPREGREGEEESRVP